MEIKLNKTLSITFSTIYLIMFTIGIPLYYLLMNQSITDICNDLSFGSSWLMALSFFLEHLSPFVIGIWMYVNANKYGLEKWTWLTFGLIYSDYALVLLILLLIIEKSNLKIDIFKSIQNLLILLIICHVLTYLNNVFFHQIFYKVLTNMGSYSHRINDKHVMFMLTNLFMIVLNVIIAISQFKKQNVTKDTNRFIWMIATMVFGLLPIVLHRGLLQLKNKNNAA